MPAAAVIPAPIAYVKIAAVKKLVVGFLVWCAEPAPSGVRACACLPYFWVVRSPFTGNERAIQIFYFEKIRVFKAGVCYEYISME